MNPKSEFDKRFLKGCLYTGITIVAVGVILYIVGYVPAFLVTLFHFLKKVLDMLMPVIIGACVAYLLHGPVTAIENFLLARKHFPIKKRGGCRACGVLITSLVVIAIIASIILGMYFMIGGQLSRNTTVNNIYKTVVKYFKTNTISTESLQKQLNKYNLPFSGLLNDKLDIIAGYLSIALSWLLNFLFGSAISFGSNLFNWLIGLILSIYFLQSSDYFIDLFRRLFYLIFRGSRVGKNLRHALYVIHFTFSNYIRGQLIEAFLVGVLTSIGLSIIGVDYAIVIGIITGICNLIPYIGPLIGTILAGIVALLGGNIWLCLWAIIVMQIIQQFDANILCPKVVGDIVGLQPAFIIIAIMIGGSYAGFVGMIIAVPVCASIKTLLSEWFESKHREKFSCSETERIQLQEEFDLAHKRQTTNMKDSFKKIFSKFSKKTEKNKKSN